MYSFLKELSVLQLEVTRETTGRFIGLVTTVGAIGYCLWRIRPKQYNKLSENHVIFITGCDSGLGYNLVLKCHSYGMTVVAGFLSQESNGCKQLMELYGSSNRFHKVQIDITDVSDIENAIGTVKNILANDENRQFYGLINNVGIMCFGEFEWQTENLITKQITTNLIGTMMVTKYFLPLLRLHKGRIITVTSHCSIQPLPGLSPYAATKVGLSFWLDALRMEMKQYDVQVVNFIPGSFWAASNLMTRQMEYLNEMKSAFTSEQSDFYGKYFDRYSAYLKLLSYEKPAEEIEDNILFGKFHKALCLKKTAAIYIHEPFRYKVYHFLFGISPLPVRDWLVGKFMINMPQFNS